ncbi:unnamed protein product, partial [Ectocarpus fasciculatus]
HTSGFEPYEKFELAPQELIASTSQTNRPKQEDILIVRPRQTDGSEVFPVGIYRLADGRCGSR